ncbi:helix-hairpin-helix domain-containing protein [Herpetosiphon gulosus]|uniref:Helix-hairpin-helix domain-containing protein n=1 Tax=Herpetosiphon gulosus TaxID=1973496 RepID=A0ABP9X9L3_9CHLR
MNVRTQESLALLRTTLNDLDNPKVSLISSIQKLLRAAIMLNNEPIKIWCEIQLGNDQYTHKLQEVIDLMMQLDELQGEKQQKKLAEIEQKIAALPKFGIIYEREELYEYLTLKTIKAGGGFQSIGFIEEKYADLVRTKRANDGTYYKSNLNTVLHYVRRMTHAKANILYQSIAFTEASQTSWDVLKDAIDNELLDLDPSLAEKLMIAFKSVNTQNPEEWSQSLTTCRRLIEGLADILFPPQATPINGRELGKNQYINRLWAYMDTAIESDSNRELAKAHVNVLGAYLQKTHKLTNKGVHSDISRLEAIKTVFHTYLVLGDLLTYLKQDAKNLSGQINIHTASLDEIESLLGINRKIAKEIIRLRVEHRVLTADLLASLNGIGTKTIQKAIKLFSFDPVTTV